MSRRYGLAQWRTSFVAYVGDPDLHDGKVVAVSRDGPDARVEVLGGSGRRYEIFFSGVEPVSDRHAQGMDDLRGERDAKQAAATELRLLELGRRGQRRAGGTPPLGPGGSPA